MQILKAFWLNCSQEFKNTPIQFLLTVLGGIVLLYNLTSSIIPAVLPGFSDNVYRIDVVAKFCGYVVLQAVISSLMAKVSQGLSAKGAGLPMIFSCLAALLASWLAVSNAFRLSIGSNIAQGASGSTMNGGWSIFFFLALCLVTPIVQVYITNVSFRKLEIEKINDLLLSANGRVFVPLRKFYWPAIWSFFASFLVFVVISLARVLPPSP